MDDLNLEELEAIEFALWQAVDRNRFTPERYAFYRGLWKKIKDQIQTIKEG